MGKFLVRLTIVFTSIYFLLSFVVSQVLGEDLIHDFYVLLFELCVVVYAFSEGKYHCRYIKYTALAILLSDTITRLDNTYDFLSVSEHNIIPIVILFVGIAMGVIKALYHFYKVSKYNDKKMIQDGKNNNKSTQPQHD